MHCAVPDCKEQKIPTHKHSNQTCRVTDFLRRTSTRRLNSEALM